MTDDKPRRSDGSYTTKYQPSDFTTAIDDLDDPTTSNIADAVGCGVGTAHRHLTQLANDNTLERTEKHAVVLWSTTDDTTDSNEVG